MFGVASDAQNGGILILYHSKYIKKIIVEVFSSSFSFINF